MPSVMQVSSPIARTPCTISTIAGMSRSLGLRHAAPMQNRWLPASLACAAACSTACTSISLVASTPLSAETDCEQYPQSSGHPPVLIDSSVHNCTSVSYTHLTLPTSDL